MGINLELTDEQFSLIIYTLKLARSGKYKELNEFIGLYPDWTETGKKTKDRIVQERFDNIKRIEELIDILQDSWIPVKT